MREAETARRRREEGVRGRLTDRTGADLPRSDPHRLGAAEERAPREDPEERQMRLSTAEHNKRQELLGHVIGAHRALGMDVEVGINNWSEQKLRERLHRLRGGDIGAAREPVIVAQAEAAL